MASGVVIAWLLLNVKRVSCKCVYAVFGIGVFDFAALRNGQHWSTLSVGGYHQYFIDEVFTAPE